MESIIPLNGRVAIVDDQIEQALPLMRVFAKNNIPYVFYKGNDFKFFPEQPENDIRILFMDLNLLGERYAQPKDVRSTLFSVISHIISPDNYPYVLVLWSRQENEYKKILENLFAEELKGCAPIIILGWIKSDFFPNFTDEEVNEDKEYKIIERLRDVIANLPAYNYLMQWENCIHNSADKTIQDIFHDFRSKDNWENNANCILDMFAHAYLEQHYNDGTPNDKAKASLLFFNDVYYDTLETNVIACTFPNASSLPNNINEDAKKNLAAKINGCILISNQFDSPRQPGCVLPPIEQTEKNRSYFHELFYCCFNNINHLPSKEAKKLKNDIYKTLQPCEVIVTPACDYAQKKFKYDRVVQGVIIDAEYKDNTNSQSAACYVSPIFEYESKKRIMVLNFRYLVTANIDCRDLKPLFRIRDSILAEIQSKLARHISRQGVMNL